jgi:hypothetical protein
VKTYTVQGVECVEIDRRIVRIYLNNKTDDVCLVCPAHTGQGKGCVMLNGRNDCPADEVLVPVEVARSPKFIAAILEGS